MHGAPLSASARTAERLKFARHLRVTQWSLSKNAAVTPSVQTLVAKRLATVYPHPRHAPRKVRSVFCSSALALCQTTAAASLNFSPLANSSHCRGATITQRSGHGACSNSLLDLLRMGYSVPVSF